MSETAVALISIHVLRVEDDLAEYAKACRDELFQSTSSVWRTTGTAAAQERSETISIHVLRVEDDR